MVILGSWGETTKITYATVLKRWKNFFCQRKIDSFQPHVTEFIKFLTEIYNEGIGYKSVCIGRSSLNTIVTLPGFPDISKHPLIKKFTKGVSNTKPPKLKYTYT